MPSPLSPETLEQIQQIAGQIQVANQLDPEIQAELCGHMEDKVATYLSGQEKITEADALLLTRVHFGDPAIIKSLFQGVHHREYSVSLARRLAAAFVANAFVGAVLGSFFTIYTYCSPSSQGQDARILLGLEVLIVWFGLLWLIFRHWRRRMERHQLLWFQTCSPMLLWMAVLGVLGLSYWVVLFVVLGLQTFFPVGTGQTLVSYSSTTFGPAMIPMGVYTVSLNIFLGLTALAWIWWCDHKPRTWRTMVCAALGCLAANFLTEILLESFGQIARNKSIPPQYLEIGLPNILNSMLRMQVNTILPFVIAMAGYVLWHRFRRSRAVLAA